MNDTIRRQHEDLLSRIETPEQLHAILIESYEKGSSDMFKAAASSIEYARRKALDDAAKVIEGEAAIHSLIREYLARAIRSLP